MYFSTSDHFSLHTKWLLRHSAKSSARWEDYSLSPFFNPSLKTTMLMLTFSACAHIPCQSVYKPSFFFSSHLPAGHKGHPMQPWGISWGWGPRATVVDETDFWATCLWTWLAPSSSACAQSQIYQFHLTLYSGALSILLLNEFDSWWQTSWIWQSWMHGILVKPMFFISIMVQ